MKIIRINKQVAIDFFQRYEHLGNCGLGVWHYGCYEKDQLISVISFGTLSFNPNRSKIAKYATEHEMRIFQLSRGGTRYDAPKNTASKSVSMALKEIRRQFGDSIIIAYSDTNWNEIGTIYQSVNFLYLGMTNPKGQSNYIVNGKLVSGWTIRKKYGTRDMNILKLIVPDITRIPLTPKHIYLFVNSSARNKQKAQNYFKSMIYPYPSRNKLNVGSMLEIRRGSSSLIKDRKQ